MEKKQPSREETYGFIEEAEGWIDAAEGDPSGVGRQLRQRIINRASELLSTTADLMFVGPSSEQGRDAVEDYLAELADIKRRAEDVRRRAMRLPV